MALEPVGGMVHRATGLNEDGLMQIYDYGWKFVASKNFLDPVSSGAMTTIAAGVSAGDSRVELLSTNEYNSTDGPVKKPEGKVASRLFGADRILKRPSISSVLQQQKASAIPRPVGTNYELLKDFPWINAEINCNFCGSEVNKLPITEDGTEYWMIIEKMVGDYVNSEWPGDTCADDPYLRNYWSGTNVIVYNKANLPPLTCGHLISLLSQFFVSVSAMHRYVGNVASEAMDPCWGPWAWREGELCGTPMGTGGTQSIMGATALNQPRIMEDYTYLFDKPASKEAWKTMIESLKDFKTRVAQRNEKRKRPFRAFEPDRVETTISI